MMGTTMTMDGCHPRWVPPSAFPEAIYHVYCRAAHGEFVSERYSNNRQSSITRRTKTTSCSLKLE